MEQSMGAEPSKPGVPSTPVEPLEPPALTPLHVDTSRVVLVGTALWLLALVVTLIVPSLHRGDHNWWPWAAVAGVVLGALGLGYLRRGRGNAAAQ